MSSCAPEALGPAASPGAGRGSGGGCRGWRGSMASSECGEFISGSIGPVRIPESTPLWSVEPKAGSMEASTASLRC
eukprot:3595454-Pyramimonas_sp.AAC.1